MQTKFKFLRQREASSIIKSSSGNLEWPLKGGKSKWMHEDNINICHKGLHCSDTILHALSYVKGEVLAVVKVKGKHIEQSDKEVWSDMRIIKAYKWSKKDSQALAIFSAETVLHIFEKRFPNDKRPIDAIEAARMVLQDDTEENRAVARKAQADAAAAAYAAAYADAYAAAAAAYAAAYAADAYAADAADTADAAAYAADAYARQAAKKELLDKINQWLEKRLYKMELIK